MARLGSLRKGRTLMGASMAAQKCGQIADALAIRK